MRYATATSVSIFTPTVLVNMTARSSNSTRLTRKPLADSHRTYTHDRAKSASERTLRYWPRIAYDKMETSQTSAMRLKR